MKGRALTQQQKRAVMERILAAWCSLPMLRLGQMLQSAVDGEKGGMFNVEDEVLADKATTMAAKFTRKDESDG